MQACSVRSWAAYGTATRSPHGRRPQRRRQAAAARTAQAAPLTAEVDSLAGEDALPADALEQPAQQLAAVGAASRGPAAGGRESERPAAARATQPAPPALPSGGSSGGSSSTAENPSSPAAAFDDLTRNLNLLRQALDTTATRLRRQLEPPPPGFPPGENEAVCCRLPVQL